MTKQNKWLALGVLLLVLAAAKVAMLGWWQNRQPENGEYMFACKHQVLASQLGFACFQAAFASAINRLKGSLKTD